ncbi:hypothetical protein [Nocardioides panaciterrulae]|uniref:Putative membrane protein n=1 Tax=Nocardioides panaciterrulae TaxID=661492 RepID=A0A7Y9E6R8_9ACTN|nr:hypothetical protein [Nocardioides panaciterrulae]NYD42238.1 putative membrane protein [Nocardioides panaciterrulae]
MERISPPRGGVRPVVDVLVLLDVLAEDGSEPPVQPATLAGLLDDRFPAGRWAVHVGHVAAGQQDREPRSQRASEAMAGARRALLRADADVVLLVTDRPLTLHGREVRAHTSPVQRCAVLSVAPPRPSAPGPGAGPARELVSLVGELLDLDGDEGDRPVLESLAEDDVPQQAGAADDGNGRGEGGRRGPNLLSETRQLLGQVAASRPWLMTLHLSRSLVGASAAAFLAIVTPDFWMLADRLSATRLVLIPALVLVVGVAVLVVGGDLRERPGPGRSRRSVRQHNAAVWLGVGLGVLTLFAVLVLASLAITLVVLPGSLVSGAIGHHAGWATMTRIGVVTAIVSLVGSVFGAGLEDDEDVQEATFTGSDDVRFAEDQPEPAVPGAPLPRRAPRAP